LARPSERLPDGTEEASDSSGDPNAVRMNHSTRRHRAV